MSTAPRVPCYICNKLYATNTIPRHVRRAHGPEYVRSVGIPKGTRHARVIVRQPTARQPTPRPIPEAKAIERPTMADWPDLQDEVARIIAAARVGMEHMPWEG